MEKHKTLNKDQHQGGISGEDQSGPVGNNDPHGRSSHADPAMQPGITQEAVNARKKEEGGKETGGGNEIPSDKGGEQP
jgi:hypothetical protein